MTIEIKKYIKHTLEIAERMVFREQPLIAAAIHVICGWINGIDYRHVRKMNADERHAYDKEKIQDLKTQIGSIEKVDVSDV